MVTYLGLGIVWKSNAEATFTERQYNVQQAQAPLTGHNPRLWTNSHRKQWLGGRLHITRQWPRGRLHINRPFHSINKTTYCLQHFSRRCLQTVAAIVTGTVYQPEYSDKLSTATPCTGKFRMTPVSDLWLPKMRWLTTLPSTMLQPSNKTYISLYDTDRPRRLSQHVSTT